MIGMSQSSRTIIAYYFFDFTTKLSLSSVAFLRCVLHQILPSERISPTVQRRIEIVFDGGLGNREPDLEEVETMLSETLNPFKRFLLIVDGIDELEEDERKLVFRSLKRIRQAAPDPRFWISGHSEVDIHAIFPTSTRRMHISPSDISVDIRHFVEAQLNEPSNILHDCCTPLKVMIQQTLVSKSQGM
jgi:hypothetical protein